MNILLDKDYNLIPEMYDLLQAIKHKYRIYLFTMVDQDDPKKGTYLKARTNIQKLIDEGIVEEHRTMYCTTLMGQMAMIRQLNAELHMESMKMRLFTEGIGNFEVIQNLHQFLNKFHLINPWKSEDDA